jgi:hypothetical protein
MLKIDRRALILSGAGLLLAGPGRSQTVPIDRYGTFTDSVGVNVHIGSPPYNVDFSTFRNLLGDSGIRHVRDELRPDNNLEQWRGLNAEFGILFQCLVSPATNTVPEMLAYLEALGPERVSAVEGQNEGDSDWFMSLAIAKPEWSKVVIDYQKAVHHALRARYSASILPIVSPSVINWKPADAALLRPAADFSDVVAIHSYVQGAQEPETDDDYAALSWYLRNMRDAFKPGAPVMATETGYCNTVKAGGGGVSETAAAAYLPRLLLNNFRLGVTRTFLYEFMDGSPDRNEWEHNWGLVHSDGSPKPSYHAIKRLLAALKDARLANKPVTEQRAFARTTSPEVQQVAFQDRAGHLILAIWRSVRCWDVQNARDIAVEAKPVEIVVDGKASAMSVTVPNDDGTWRKVTGLRETMTIPVAEKIVLVRFVF